MLPHIRANLWLLGLTLLLCCVVYPLALWGVAQVAFRDRAQGSLIYDNDTPVASRLIAHEVKGEEFFQPRPSATSGSSWNAAASGASNWAANNYLLRDRVARALGPIVTFAKGPQKGELVAPDVVKWFREERPGLVADWATAHNALAQAWAKSEQAAGAFILEWFERRPADLHAWTRKNPGKDHTQPSELAVAFFEGFSREYPSTWLTIADSKTDKTPRGEPAKLVALVEKSDDDAADIAAVFFDLWRDAHPEVELEPVPADLVLASASGLDPHITLRNAHFQLNRVAGKWAALTGQDPTRLRGEIEELLRRNSSAPLFGLAGVEMVNVIEVNLALQKRYTGSARR